MNGIDIRDLLRTDHETALADLEALRLEADSRRALQMLEKMRRSWVIHALAEETVVYRALEGAEAMSDDPKAQADERFIEHELVGGLFDRIAQARCGTLEWKARLNVVRDIMSRHMESEHADLFRQLAERFDAGQLCELGRRFVSARDKLALLERAKAA